MSQAGSHTRSSQHLDRLARGLFYRPIDEILAEPRIRILRTLNRFNWMYLPEINDLLDVREYLDRNLYSVTIGRLVWFGLVETRHVTTLKYFHEHYALGAKFEYHITTEGRDELREALDNQAIEIADQLPECAL